MKRRSELGRSVIEEGVENKWAHLFFYLNVLSGIKTGNKIFIFTRFFLIKRHIGA